MKLHNRYFGSFRCPLWQKCVSRNGTNGSDEFCILISGGLSAVAWIFNIHLSLFRYYRGIYVIVSKK